MSFDFRAYVTEARFDSSGEALGADYSRWNDVYLTLQGKYGARSTRTDPNDENSTVMYVAAPIRDGNKIIGVLTVAKPNQTVAPFIARSQGKILTYGLLLIGGAALIGVVCTLWLVFGLRKLRRYARAVEAGERAEMPLRGASELAELGRAVESMRLRLLDERTAVLWGGSHLPCRPCYDGREFARCADNVCMSSIAPSVVLATARSLLNRARPRGDAMSRR